MAVTTMPSMRAWRRGTDAALIIWLAASVGCATASGARRGQMSEAEEIEQGKEAAAEVEAYIGFSGSDELNAYVDQIGQRLAAHSGRSHLTYEFHVVDMAEPNAFALPGGHIYVSRGLLAILNTEDELANVLGHEIGHVDARHSVERQSASRPWVPLRVLAGIGGAAASVVSPELGAAVSGAVQAPAALALAKYSRSQEQEADRLGQQYAAAAGWDPAGMASSMDALTREQQYQGTRDPGQRSFFDTHPTTPERSRDAQAYAQTLDAVPPNRIAQDRNTFVRRLDGLVSGESGRTGVVVGRRFLHPELEIAMTFPESWAITNAPEAVYALAPDETALVALGVAAQGDDPSVVADELEQETPLIDRSPVRTVNGLDTVSATARANSRSGEVLLRFTWIAKDGLIYEVVGAAPASRFAEHQRTIAAAADSVRPLEGEELAEVEVDRLRLVEARSGETLTDVAARSHSAWTPAQMSVANDIPEGTAIPPGELVKITKTEAYEN